MTIIQLLFFLVLAILIFLVARLLLKPVKIVMHLFKIAMLVALLILVGLFVLGGLIIKDANTFRQEFSNSTNLFILMEDGKILSAVGVKATVETIKTNTDVYTIINESKMAEYEKYYAKDDLKSIGKGYYKVVIYNTSLLNEYADARVADRNINLSMAEIKTIMTSDNPKSEFVDIVSKQNSMNREQLLLGIAVDDLQFKGMMFSYVITYTFNPSNVRVLMTGIREKQILIYEETLMFKAMRLIPSFLAMDTLKIQEEIPINISMK